MRVLFDTPSNQSAIALVQVTMISCILLQELLTGPHPKSTLNLNDIDSITP